MKPAVKTFEVKIKNGCRGFIFRGGAMKLGHVQLKVSDLQRAIQFYTDVLGMHVVEVLNEQYAFLSLDDAHHRLALQSVGSQAPPPHRCSTGLQHIAFEVSSEQSLAEACQILKAKHIRVEAVDHGISYSLYFNDTDGNGLEIYCDVRDPSRGRTRWRGVNHPLTLTTACGTQTGLTGCDTRKSAEL